MWYNSSITEILILTQYRMSLIGSNDYLLEVAKGNVDGTTLIIVRGHNPDVDSATEEDIWEGGGDLSYLSSAETMDVVSTDIDDSDTGGVNPQSTGARTVILSGVDGTGALITEVVTLDGTTAVTTTATFLRVNSMVLLTAGSSGWNEGNITATATTALTLQCEMDATEGISQNSHYTVPLAKTGYLYQIELNASKTSGGGTPQVEFKGYARNNGGAWLQLFDKRLSISVTEELDVMLPFPSAMVAQTDIRLRLDTDTNNTEVRTRMYILLVDD